MSRVAYLGTSSSAGGSLSAEERKTSEQAFAEAQNCVIVATCTLELGIDVGDLDRVIQVDAPWSVASFLQRLGRTGRRSGSTRNCLFLATSEDALLRAGALLKLWEAGFVEPVIAPPRPLHLFAQQLMALSLQKGGIGIRDWQGLIGRLPAFDNEDPLVLESVIEHLQKERIFYSDGIQLSFGDAGVDLYGRRHFLELVSVFTSDPVFKVMHGQKELGSVDQLTFARHTDDDPAVLSMGGRSWSVVSLDWRRREAFVVPTEGRGKSRWQGGKIGMSYKFSRAVHSLLVSDHVSDRWTARACDMFASVRAEYGFLVSGADVVVGDSEARDVRWYTFAGGLLNTALADMLKLNGCNDVSATDFCIRIEGTTDALGVIELIQSADAEEIYSGFMIVDDFIENLKFSECLPLHLSHELIRERLLRVEDLSEVMERDVTAVYV